MELALHVRNRSQMRDADAVMRHVSGFYQETLNIEGFFDLFQKIGRIYVGDEFCFHRLPTVSEMRDFCRFSEEHDVNMTFLTPPMTDWQLEKCSSLLACLENDCPGAEVVANDPGVLWHLKKTHPGLPLAAGRLFNKGFKDPRFSDQGEADSISLSMRQALDESTFCHSAFLDHLRHIGVSRIEEDLMPYGKGFMPSRGEMNVSIYFPFGIVTCGRICQMAAQERRGRKKYLISRQCERPCAHQTLEIAHERFQFRLFQNGNTIYYLYSPAMLSDLLNKAADGSFRMVYQGMAF
jgi:hypothetical protein